MAITLKLRINTPHLKAYASVPNGDSSAGSHQTEVIPLLGAKCVYFHGGGKDTEIWLPGIIGGVFDGAFTNITNMLVSTSQTSPIVDGIAASATWTQFPSCIPFQYMPPAVIFETIGGNQNILIYITF